jgi:hypothetical protein
MNTFVVCVSCVLFVIDRVWDIIKDILTSTLLMGGLSPLILITQDLVIKASSKDCRLVLLFSSKTNDILLTILLVFSCDGRKPHNHQCTHTLPYASMAQCLKSTSFCIITINTVMYQV